MALPRRVTIPELQEAFEKGGNQDPPDIMMGPNVGHCWQPLLIWSASQFLEENLLFMAAAAKYQQQPTQQKMQLIYRRYVGHGRAEAPRRVNIPNKVQDETMEIVTGARTKALPGGCRRDAFLGAVGALRAFVSNDINNRFGAALRQPAGTTFTMMEGRAVELETDLRLLREVGISF